MAEQVAASPRPRRERRTFGLLVAGVVAIGLLFAFALPGRTYLDQRRAVAAAHARVEVLDRESRRLEERTAVLQTDAEVERLAREQYGLVKPGEEAFGILPAPGSAPPEEEPPAREPGWWERLSDRLSFWD